MFSSRSTAPVSSRTAAAFASGAIRHEPRGNGSATRLYHFDDAGRLLILQLVAESLAGLAGDAGGRPRTYKKKRD